MLKKSILLLSFLLLLFPVFGNNYTFQVPTDYLGTYIQNDFCTVLEKTKSLDEAYINVPNDAHFNLFLIEDSCFTTRGGEYGFITTEELENYDFYKEGYDYFVKDDKGFIYKRISLKKDFSEVEFRTYVQNIMFDCIEDLKNVRLVRGGATLEIDEAYHNLVSFYESIHGGKSAPTGRLGSVNEDFYLKDGNNFLAAKLSGLSATFYVVKKTNMGYEYTNEVKFEFPIFSYKPMIPMENMTKAELRLYRNIQFARHGYNFKSPDLQHIFSQFEWYKPAPAGTKIVLTKEEQDIVDLCLKYEAQPEKERTVLRYIRPGSTYNSGVTIADKVPLYKGCNKKSEISASLEKGTFVQLLSKSTNPDDLWYEIAVPYTRLRGFVRGENLGLYFSLDGFNEIKEKYNIKEILPNTSRDKKHHILYRALISPSLEVTIESAGYETVVYECYYFKKPYDIWDTCFKDGKIIGRMNNFDKVKILEVVETNNYTDDWKDSLDGYCMYKVKTGELSGNVTGWVFGDKTILSR